MGRLSFRIVTFPWGAAGTESARRIRREVFIEEQAVPEAEEWDAFDAPATHFLLRSRDGVALGTARLTPDGRIGRVAVAAHARGQGLGEALVKAAVELAQDRSLEHVVLDSQTYALGFYERMGFVAEGPEFLDAGIPHRRMTRPL